MEYQDIFKPQTLAKLNKKSAENLKSMLGDKTLMQTMIQSQTLLDDIAKAEAPYKEQLEQLAVEMVEKLYPIINEEDIKIDAKIVGMGDVNSTLDEIKVNKPFNTSKFPIKINNKEEYDKAIQILSNRLFKWNHGGDFKEPHIYVKANNYPFYLIQTDNHQLQATTDPTYQEKKYPEFINESITPESRRRIINGITQGAALRGAFSFYLFKDYLDAIDDTLIDKYNQIMKNSFGIYDDDNAIAMMLSMLAQGQKAAGGSSKVIINEIKVNTPGIKYPLKINNYEELNKWISNTGYKGVDPTRTMKYPFYIYYMKLGNLDHYSFHQKPKPLNEQQESGITIQARALNFPMLVHEIIKGLYELISLQGFKGDKQQNQDTVDKVDKLKHEPHDIKYGKLIFDALNDIFADSQYSDPRIREFFFTEVYQLDDSEFIDFVENAINEELTPGQKKWVDQTLKEISIDLKSDDFDAEGLDEIKINKPEPFIKDKKYNIKIKDNDDFKIDENDLINLEFWKIKGDYYLFISTESGEIVEIPKNKLTNYKEVK